MRPAAAIDLFLCTQRKHAMIRLERHGMPCAYGSSATGRRA